MNRKLIIAAAFGAIVLGGLTIVAQSSDEATVHIAEEATLTRATFSVENMTCATCPIAVSKAMRRVEGVKSVEIDYETKIATVVFDPDETNASEIGAASTGVGYPAALLES